MLKNWVADLIEAQGGRIQRFPVDLNPSQDDGYEVVFTLESPKGVIDLSRVERLEIYENDDGAVDMRYGGVAPRQRGMFYRVRPLYIDPEKACGMTLFRPWEKGALIVSASLKLALEAAGVTGVAYREAN